jgi:hypothetical protein
MYSAERLNKEVPFQEPKVDLPRAGSLITLRKLYLHSDEWSDVGVGQTLSGSLVGPIEIGRPILFDSGSRTSTVRSIEQDGRKVSITTETSVYEIDDVFEGLSLKTGIGTVAAPIGMKAPQLLPGEAPPLASRNSKNNEVVRVHINRDELKDVLLETGGAVVHRLGPGRYFVVARVGGAHLPFYRSSKGTSGKHTGEWYPFFGDTGAWIIKGGIDQNGNMHYHPAITSVQEKLNQHLILPNPIYVNRDFNMTSSDGRIIYALGKEIPMAGLNGTDYLARAGGSYEDATRMYVEDMTGYRPTTLSGYHPSTSDASFHFLSRRWINDIVAAVDAAQGNK